MYFTIFNFILAGCILSGLPVVRGRVPEMNQGNNFIRLRKKNYKILIKVAFNLH